MNVFLLLCFLCLVSCTSHRMQDQSHVLTNIQCVDRNGLSETISNAQRLRGFRAMDFFSSQPYKKVLRVYGRNSQGQSPTKITTYHDNGQIWQYLEAMNGRAHGKYQEWHQNGQLKIEAFVIEGIADLRDNAALSWVFDGVSKVWDEYGCLVAEITYEKGALHTPSTYYFPNGQVQKTIPFHEGKIDGVFFAYDVAGNAMEEVYYTKGKKNGIAIAYWNAKEICSMEEYAQDFLVQGVYFDSLGNQCAEVVKGNGDRAEFVDGKLAILTEYKEGIPEGNVRRYRIDGTMHSCYATKDGKKEGVEWEYYPTKVDMQPIPKLFLHWHDDKLQGIVKTWYSDGVQESQWEMQENKRQGYAFAWYKNGELMFSEEYANDLLVEGMYYKRGESTPISRIEKGSGRATLFNAEGALLHQVEYEKGKPSIDHG
jgi:antitoxin component YwqK of YwqJK toxin-antitoxin module